MTADTSSEDLGRTTVRQVARRLLPLLFLMFLIDGLSRQIDKTTA